MLALLYLLGFLSGGAAAVVIMLIISACRRKKEVADDLERGFMDILNY
ncbi:MAG: hypothetical protein IJF48_04260 [Clostridia bacterium]|nr:hypothetical protein [Clostridia bacterium]